MGRLYLKSGFLNPKRIIDSPAPFVLCVGGRGIGKTYGVLKELYERRTPYIYMRRTQAQIDISMSEDFNPWRAIDGAVFAIRPVNRFCAGLFLLDENGEPDGEPLTIGAALSTFANLRGFNSAGTQAIVFDEFIPEAHEKALKNEGAALLNAYETVNRNRELTGQPPVKLIALANSNNLGNPLFSELGLVDTAIRMQQKGIEAEYMPDRGIELLLLQNSPISEAKRQTALYKATQAGRFMSMSLDNEFQTADIPIRSRVLTTMTCLWCVGATSANPAYNPRAVAIYRPNGGGHWYCTHQISGRPEFFGDDPDGLKRFQRITKLLPLLHIKKMLDYEDYSCYTVLKEKSNW